ncbi:MAG: phosphate ABC transporter permease PstA, partial [candidate division WOR-3 bacterium]
MMSLGVDTQAWRRREERRERLFLLLAALVVLLAMTLLLSLLVKVLLDGYSRLGWDFLNRYPSSRPGTAGIKPAVVGSFYLISLTALLAIPIGVGAAIYLEELARKGWWFHFIEINIANLAGVPSIIYGLLGLQLFVRVMRFEESLLAGACTMALLVLPVIIVAAREALRAVPRSLREGSLALGATQWQTVRYQLLPVALPGILTGVILALSRAMGETAPLIVVGAVAYIHFLPDGLFSPFTVLPIQIFNWVSRPQRAFHENAAAAIIVLLLLLLSMNGLAIWLR